MKKKINASLLWLSVAMILLTAALGLLIDYHFFEKQFEADLSNETRILRDTGLFDDTAADTGRFRFDPEIMRVTWIDSDGTVLYDNESDPADMGNHKNRPEVKQALSDGEGKAVRRSDTLNKSTYYSALRLSNGSVVRVSKVRANMLSLFETTLPGLVFIIILTVLLSIVLAHILTRGLISPIEDMAEHMGSSSMAPPYPELVPFASKIRAQHEDILRSAKMRQDFTANVSHELKTPLTAISGYAELIENGMTDGPETVRFAHEIEANSKRLLSLINDIIKLSQLDSYEEKQPFEKVDLDRIARTCVDNLQVPAQKNKVRLFYEGETSMVLGSEEMLAELVTNLCDNSIRYNYPDGYVRVSVRAVGGSTVLTVKDNGIGIPKEQQDRVFERFYRVDKSRSKKTGGPGLGLALVKHIVLLHSATLTLDSAPGVGTTITVKF